MNGLSGTATWDTFIMGLERGAREQAFHGSEGLCIWMLGGRGGGVKRDEQGVS